MKLIDILNANPKLNNLESLIGTDKNTVHNYINGFYEKEFSKYTDKDINLLEIGTSSGGSLYLWSKFFKNALIYGIDVQDLVQSEYKNIENVHHLIGNGYTIEMINSLPEFDIIIDDGSHAIQDQIFVVKNYINKLKDQGVLIIEDVQHQDHLDILKDHIPQHLKNKIEYIDLRQDKNRYDDMMFVFRK